MNEHVEWLVGMYPNDRTLAERAVSVDPGIEWYEFEQLLKVQRFTREQNNREVTDDEWRLLITPNQNRVRNEFHT